MAQEKKSKKTPPSKVKLIEKEGLPTYYANHLECRVSNEEIVFTFARRKYEKPEEEAEAIVRTYISVPHFIRFSNLIIKQLNNMVKMKVLPKEVLDDVISGKIE